MPGARVKRGERVALRTVEAEDAAFVQRANADPAIRHPLGTALRSRGEMDAVDEDADALLVCVEGADASAVTPDDGEDVTPIGEVHVLEASYKRPRIGYWIVPESHGEGYGTEAVALALDYVFRQYDAPAVGAGAYDDNAASRALLESLGFREEGRRRAFAYADGAHRDMVEYGLLREEWNEGD